MTLDRVRCVIVADDLTGAADSSAALAAHGLRVRILPWPSDGDVESILSAALAGAADDVLVIETASRELDPPAAGRRIAAITTALRGVTTPAATAEGTQVVPWIIKKIDSVLRGPIAAEVGALRAGTGSTTTVVAPAFPRLGRTTVDGVQLVDGVPVGTSPSDPVPGRSAGDAEVARACGLTTATLRGAGDGPLAGAVTVHDARTDSDLERLATALLEEHPRPLVVCTAGLLEHLAPHLARDASAGLAEGDARTRSAGGALLVISLSPTAAAVAQLDDLVAGRGALRVDLVLEAAISDPAAAGTRLGHELAAALADAGRSTIVVLGLADEERIASGTEASAVREAILRAVDAALAVTPRPPLVLANGGDSARLVLDRWFPSSLEVVGPLPHGAALARGGDGAQLAMKSGGFGPTTALSDIVDALAAGPVHVAGAHPS